MRNEAPKGLEAGRGAKRHLDRPIGKHGEEAQRVSEPKPAGGFDRQRTDDKQSSRQGEEGFARPAGRRLKGLRKVVAAWHAKKARQNERADAEDRQQQETLRGKKALKVNPE